MKDDTISRQQAIDVIDKIFPADPMRNDYTQGITCGAALATEYIKQLPSVQPETHDKHTETHACDCISREDVEQTVEDNILCYTHSDRPIDQDPDTECHMAIRTALRMLRKDLRKLPSAQPEPKPDKNGSEPFGNAEMLGDRTTDDCISRQQAVDALIEQMPNPFTADGSHPADEGIFRVQETYADCIETIKLLPSVQPERKWMPCSNPPKHHKDVIVRGIEAIGNVTVHKVMQWDVDTWRPTDYAPSVTWKEWSEI